MKYISSWAFKRVPHIFPSLRDCLTRIKVGVLNINQKLFSRAIVAHHKILILLQAHFTINKRRSNLWRALQFQIVWTILDAAIFFMSTQFQMPPKSTWINIQGFHHFQHFGPCKTFSRITVSTILYILLDDRLAPTG